MVINILFWQKSKGKRLVQGDVYEKPKKKLKTSTAIH